MEISWKIHGEDFAVPYAILDLVEEGILIDSSWRNDACPKFTVKCTMSEDGSYTCIWVAHPKPALRETSNTRYCVSTYVEGEMVSCHETNSLEEVFKIIS